MVTEPKNVQRVHSESQPEVENAVSHSEIGDFITPEAPSEDPAHESTIKTAKATKEVNFLGNDERTNRFVGVRYARVAKPKYPRHARKMGWEGTTLLRVLVDQKGEAEFIEISRSSGFTTLDKAAAKAVKHWRFQPARSGSKTIESWVKIPIVFDLEELKK